MRRILSYICLLLLLPLLTFAQLEVKNLYGISGKKEATVKVISQDLDGFLLLATSDGLFRYDGQNSTRLFNERFKGESEITALYADSRNVLWIGTKNGLLFSYKNKQLDSVIFPYGEEDEAAKITSILTFKDRLYIGTYGNGLFSIKGNEVKNIRKAGGLSDDVIYRLCAKEDEILWCGTDGGITEITGADQTLQFRSISTKNGLPDNIVRDLYYNGKRLAIAMQDSGVCFYSPSSKKINYELFFKNWSFGAIVNVHDDLGGILTIASEKNGLIQIRGGKFTVYNYPDVIKTGQISQMYCDREKTYWLASSKGLSHLFENRYQLVPMPGTEEEHKILALTADQNNTIWIATSRGFSKVTRDDRGKINVLPVAEGKNYVASCAAIGPNGQPWFGTYGNGIAILSKDHGTPYFLTTGTKDLINDNVSSIYFDKDNIVYIATLGGGILKASYNPDKKSLDKISSYTENEGLGSNYVYSAISGTDGLLYAATDGGGLQVLKNGRFENLTKKFNFKSTTAFSLCRDPMGHLVATSNADGLLHYDGKTLRHYSSTEGLRDEQPPQIIASDNNLLCIHSKGIDRLNCATDAITFYNLPESDIEINLNAVAHNSGFVYSGTSNGLIMYRTGKERNDSIKPKITLRQLYLNYKPFPRDSAFEFKHNQNSLGFSFFGIWLKRPDQLRYRYRLNGLEEEWQTADEGKTITYNNLNPGNYSFIVQVQNDEDVWSDPETYSFIILTPIWKRWWFWVSILILVSTGFYFFVRYRLKSLQRENLMLEERVRLRTEQIEKQGKVIEEKNKALEQLSLVASKTDNVVLILDADGNLEYINESFEKLNGMNMQQLKERFGNTIYELSNNAGIREIITTAVNQKRSVNYESRNNKVEGVEIWESSTLTPIFDERGALRKIIIIDTDVTLRKKQEQIIIQKNKDITDSIAYARKIQHAILPPIPYLQRFIPDLFVTYLTKDIVSGDFFWFGHFEDYSIIAAVDCTGHGVPGAFMSLIGYNQLNRIVNEKKIHDPGKILEELNEGVLSVLHKNESESKDGMDTAICKINHKTNTLQYAGAMRPLWVFENAAAEFTEVRADKIPIGTKPSDREGGIHYTTHELELKPGNSYYIFTDGYADQFGGPKDKKYSTARFRELLKNCQSLSWQVKKAEIEKEHYRWKAEHEQVDDILVIGFTVGKKATSH